jgi:hypothetical protein
MSQNKCRNCSWQGVGLSDILIFEMSVYRLDAGAADSRRRSPLRQASLLDEGNL